MTPLDALTLEVGHAKHFPAFLRYHQRFPVVFKLFCQFTLELIGAGRKRYGAHGVIQRLRWETAINPELFQGFKISNCHFPFYARLFMLMYPEHNGFFRTRAVK